MSSKIQNTPNRAAFDVRGAADLRDQFKQDPQGGLKAAAQQFETLFLQMVLKSMRDATPQDGLMSSDQSRFYTGMLDQQMAQNMATSGQGVGFARLIEKQLGQTMQNASATVDMANAAKSASDAANLSGMTTDQRHLQFREVPSRMPTSIDYLSQAKLNTTVSGTEAGSSVGAVTPNDFVNRVWPSAVEASRSTGIPPQFLVAQAALETGWGKSEIRKADGSSSYNLFGVKAGKSWQGESAQASTTEYIGGSATQSVERFRAYSSYEESFKDYANLLRNNPRFSAVIGSQDGTEFAKRLQQAGYATDPAYADKLARIINGPTLRQALIG